MDKRSFYESERLSFRGIERKDAELIVRWRGREENYRNFFNSHAITLEEHLAWYERYLNDATRYDFMIINDEGIPVGTVGLSDINDFSCEISYMIGEESARGKGFAKEAVKAMSQIALSDLGMRGVFARIKPENAASIHVVEGVGFVQTEAVFCFGEENF